MRFRLPKSSCSLRIGGRQLLMQLSQNLCRGLHIRLGPSGPAPFIGAAAHAHGREGAGHGMRHGFKITGHAHDACNIHQMRLPALLAAGFRVEPGALRETTGIAERAADKERLPSRRILKAFPRAQQAQSGAEQQPQGLRRGAPPVFEQRSAHVSLLSTAAAPAVPAYP